MPKTGRPRKTEVIKREAEELIEELVQGAEERSKTRTAREPGAIINGMKVPWTKKEVEARFPLVTFMPNRTRRHYWNGLVYDFVEGEEATVPSVVRDAYLHTSKVERQKEVMPIGVGALTEEDFARAVTT